MFVVTWDDEFVSEVVRTLKACRVLLGLPFFYLCYSQIDNNLGTVAAGMTLNGTPNDLVQNLNPICLVIGIPILDLLVYPALRRRKINFTPIKRITLGFFIAGLGMLYAAILEKYIYANSPCHDNLPSECTRIPEGGTKEDAVPWPSKYNVWIVSGPYILVAIAEMFTSLVANEYAFTKAPKRMRSTVSAFALFMSALSSAINFALVEVNVENVRAFLPLRLMPMLTFSLTGNRNSPGYLARSPSLPGLLASSSGCCSAASTSRSCASTRLAQVSARVSAARMPVSRTRSTTPARSILARRPARCKSTTSLFMLLRRFPCICFITLLWSIPCTTHCTDYRPLNLSL